MENYPKNSNDIFPEQSVRFKILDIGKYLKARRRITWILGCCLGPLIIPLFFVMFDADFIDTVMHLDPLKIVLLTAEILIIILFIHYNKKRKGGFNYQRRNILEFRSDKIIQYEEYDPSNKRVFEKSQISKIELSVSNVSVNGVLTQILWIKIKSSSSKLSVIKINCNYMDIGQGGVVELTQNIYGILSSFGYPQAKVTRNFSDNMCFARLFALVLMMGFLGTMVYVFG